MPHERSLVQKYSSDSFVILGINSDSDPERFRALVREHEVLWPNVFEGDPGGPLATQWNVRGWPSSWLVDANGVIRARGLEVAALEAAIDRCLDR